MVWWMNAKKNNCELPTYAVFTMNVTTDVNMRLVRHDTLTPAAIDIDSSGKRVELGHLSCRRVNNGPARRVAIDTRGQNKTRTSKIWDENGQRTTPLPFPYFVGGGYSYFLGG